MTGNKCLLDTSIIIHYFKKNSDIITRLHAFSEIFVPSIAAGELYYGAYRSANVQKHLDQTHGFLKNYTILVTDIITANLFGSIKTALKSKGKPIPENDIWIAAASIQANVPLVTRDPHFHRIGQLKLVEY